MMQQKQEVDGAVGRKSIYLLIFGIMLILSGCFANQSQGSAM
ncbi:hypothetical protein [Anaerovibrio lipolyticus]|nr:hypothetical protein [Anaerovibrio lipolyticus]